MQEYEVTVNTFIMVIRDGMARHRPRMEIGRRPAAVRWTS